MISPIQLDKTYGALHTENFFSFIGFAKKVGSDEIQKIDVFLDDKLIDTIEANEFIQKIDDMYDVENKAFKYNLPSEHIGKKAIIYFKNHDSGEELLNSPYNLIDRNHEKFNEASFFYKLYFEFDNKKIQNINTKDSIGFLATEDNILNKDFIKLINTFLEKNIDSRFKAFYFNNQQKKLISEKFNKYLSKIDFIMPKDIYDIANNTSIYIHSSTANEKPKDTGYYKIWQVLNQIKANMFLINIFEAIDEKEYSKSLKLVDNCKIEFEKSVVSKIFEDDERYNEFCFMNSLKKPIGQELKSIYHSNSIGFLANKDNLKDQEFVTYLNQLMKDFPEYNFKVLYLNRNYIKELEEKFNFNNLEYIELKNIKNIFNNIEIYLTNYEKTNTDKIENNIVNKLRNESLDIFIQSLYLHKDEHLSIKQYSEFTKSYYNKFFNNLNYFGFKKEDIEKYGYTFYELFYQKTSNDYNIDINFNMNESLRRSLLYWNLKLGFKNHNYFKKLTSLMNKLRIF